MNLIRDLETLSNPLRNAVLTIGNFDGVHRGHLALFDLVKQRAEAIDGRSAVMTFEPHPLKVIKKGNGPPIITATEQKLKLIRDAGIEVIFCIPFTIDFASISAETFVREVLVKRIGVKEVVVGHDYTFGRGRQGNLQLLQRMGQDLEFKVHLVGPVHINHTLVSSTSIRTLIREGNLQEAKRLLGRDFQVWGTVVKGANRGGRLLGFPTANLKPSDQLTPKPGVYAVSVDIEGEHHFGVTNVGYNPTFGDSALSVETHILDFSRDIVGQEIKLGFLHRLRDEKRYDSVKELTDQISQDIRDARHWFEEHSRMPSDKQSLTLETRHPVAGGA
ncbi:MAG: bifunctional riboflavin kinase/FAD synthetase [Deltaproteobacteria bacterium]|nr:bifunctional riboflavin kinase/FAD synthetase [Deltaproteobacteria bacterium]